MERWFGKVAIVTGCSSGIGSAIAIDLVKAGMIVVGFARRSELVEQLRQRIPATAKGKLHAVKCDVTKESEIKYAFNWVAKQFGGCDVFVNNAGVSSHGNIVDENNTEKIKSVIDTNLTGAVLCIREAYQSMRKKGVDGHIIIINSILGHNVIYGVNTVGSFNVYPPTKFALTGMTEVLRQEMQALKSKIKISSISPGGTSKTEIFSEEHASKLVGIQFLEPEDVSATLLFVLGTPPHVQVHDIIVRPVGEPY